MTSFNGADDVFAYLDRFVSPNAWAIPKHLRAQRLALMARAAGHPERCAPVFHIAGSKGKGSVTGMIAAALDASGRRAARCVSPHVGDVRERIMLGGRFLDERVYAACGEETRALNDTLRDAASPAYRLFYGAEEDCYPPTYFELLTFYYFFCARQAGADVQVVETGMGGRFDPTNVVDPLVSVISVIELEHTEFLGGTVAEIAFEKAGIIKPGKPVVVAAQPVADGAALEVFRRVAREKDAPLFYLPDLASIEDIRVTKEGTAFRLVPKDTAVFSSALELSVGIPGAVQAHNAALAAAALKVAMPQTPDAALADGLRSFTLPARFERIADDPPAVIDGAHTALSVGLAVKEWAALYGRGGVLLFGCAQDKDAAAMARHLVPCFSFIVITEPGSYRSSPPQRVFDAFTKEAARMNAACVITLTAQTREAIDGAFTRSRAEGLPLFCAGSFYLAAAVRNLKGPRTAERPTPL
jgi:dihydrofolate synthase/folylpolyglutamate synthase